MKINDISLVCRCTFCISCVLKTLIQQVKHNKVPISPIELHSNMNSKFYVADIEALKVIYSTLRSTTTMADE